MAAAALNLGLDVAEEDGGGGETGERIAQGTALKLALELGQPPLCLRQLPLEVVCMPAGAHENLFGSP
jgi:hypothetical protein